MKYNLKFSSKFKKDFSELDSVLQSKILVVLESMQLNPLRDIKKLKSTKVGIFRRRIGEYRLRFDIFKKDIYLYRIRHRKDVYKN